MADRAGLSGKTATADIDKDVKLVAAFNDLQRLPYDHLECFPAEIIIQGFFVDEDVSCAGPDKNPGHGRFTTAGSVILDGGSIHFREKAVSVFGLRVDVPKYCKFSIGSARYG